MQDIRGQAGTLDLLIARQGWQSCDTYQHWLTGCCCALACCAVLCCAAPCCAVLCRVLLQLKKLHKLDLSQLHFVGESLTALRKEVGNTAAVLGELSISGFFCLVCRRLFQTKFKPAGWQGHARVFPCPSGPHVHHLASSLCAARLQLGPL
jgi:hypothetical protein